MNVQKNNSTVLLFTSVILAIMIMVGAGCAVTSDQFLRTNVSVPEISVTAETSPGTPVMVQTEPTETTPTEPVKNNAMVNVNAVATVTEPKKPVVSQVYKDGVYTAIGNYMSPAGPEEIGVTATMKADIIVDVMVEPKATVAKSKMMQADFALNYKVLVVGKNIADVKLTKVSGSSLTSGGFNDALVKIMAQAKI